MRTLRWTTAILLLLSLAAAASARAALTLEPIGSFAQPIYVTSDPGNPNRLFVVERAGIIELVKGGTKSTFVDLTSLVRCCDGERGLLSMALAPDFDATGRFYVDYTGEDGPGNIHVDELTASGDSAGLTTRRPLLTIPHSGADNHNGGQLQFGPDGDLYVSTGDGGGANDQFHNAQDPNSLLGKILRIDPQPSGSQPYTVPADNPFASPAPFNTIWSYGLRNPFRFSFDRLSGDMVIGDVGQGAREEVDYALRTKDAVGGGGADYGWNCREGLIAGPATDPQCLSPPLDGFADPVFDYPHTPDPDVGGVDRCAIIGGYVVRDRSLGDLYGRYLYADLCTGDIRSLSLDDPFATDRSELLHVDNPNSFGEDSCGRIYVVSGNGEVDRLVGGSSAPESCSSPVPPLQTPPQGLRPPDLRTGSFVRVSAIRRVVRHGGTAFITAWVTPCTQKRKGEPVHLRRDGRPNGTKALDRACAAHFHPRIRRRTTFTVFYAGNDDFQPATSRGLTIRAVHHRIRVPAFPSPP